MMAPAQRRKTKVGLADLVEMARGFIRQSNGPITEELARVDGGWGLGQVPKRLVPDSTTTSVCGFCSTGCGLRVHLKDGAATNLSPDSEYPVNLGMACPKGWEALAPSVAEDRATEPLLRNSDGAFEAVSWDRAMHEMVARIRAVQQEHGDESTAFLSTGQIPTEEMLFLGALARFGMGIRHGDGNTRQCITTAIVAYKECFGFDAPPFTYADLEESDVIVLVGSNLCIAHPILWQRVTRNSHDPEIIVVDPRRTETAMASTLHLPLSPKSDLPLFYAVAQVLIERGWIDRDYVASNTEGFAEFADHVAQFTPEAVAEAVGLPASAIVDLTERIHRGKRVSFWWTMGVNQGHEAVRTAQALIALALITGNMGRPGTGANSITGQNNAMGSRLFSNTTGLFAGRAFDDSEDRREVAKILGIDETKIPETESLAYDQIIDEIEAGRIKALWVIATNGSHSWTNQSAFRTTLEKLDFLVVQDLFADTETALQADLVLPAAGWGEKDGTFINSERRIGLTKKVSRAPGQALSDFNIFRLVAHYWGCGEVFERWKTPEDVFDVMKRLSEGRPCDISGIGGYQQLERDGGIQWPWPSAGAAVPPATERRLFEDGRYFTASGRARFRFEAPRPVVEPTNDAYPLVLLTGRGSSSEWHTQTRTKRSAVLRKLARREPWVEIHPTDARHARVEPGELVRVSSRRGAIEVRAVVTSTVGQGRVFVPMHFATTNQLTRQVVDPYSRQPSYKHCAVAITPV